MITNIEEANREIEALKENLKSIAKDYLREGREQDQKITMLREAIRETIMDNLHLADGDNCTLKRLKDAIKFQLEPEP